jgi:hypothetical protein
MLFLRRHLLQKSRDVETVVHRVIDLEGEFRRVPETEASSELPPQEPRRASEPRQLPGMIRTRPPREEDSRVAKVGGQIHLRDNHLRQTGVLDLPQEKSAEFAQNQIADPVGTSKW